MTIIHGIRLLNHFVMVIFLLAVGRDLFRKRHMIF